MSKKHLFIVQLSNGKKYTTTSQVRANLIADNADCESTIKEIKIEKT